MLTREELTQKIDGWLRELSSMTGTPHDERVASFLATRLIEAGIGDEDWDVTTMKSGRRVRITARRGGMIEYSEVGHDSSFGLAPVRDFSDNERLASILDRLEGVNVR